MNKSLTEMVAEIVVAQASHGPMSPQNVEDMIKRTFHAFTEIHVAEKKVGLPVNQAFLKGSLPALPQAIEKTSGMKGEWSRKIGSVSNNAVDPMSSIEDNLVTCLECGQKLKQLSFTHLKSHGLNTNSYREKFGFPARFPLTAKSLSEKRKSKARETGLGTRLKEARKKRK